MTKLSATKVARRFSDILNRVRYGRESFTVVRNGEPVCRIEPVESLPSSSLTDLLDLLAAAPWPDSGFADDLERIQQDQPHLPEAPWDS